MGIQPYSYNKSRFQGREGMRFPRLPSYRWVAAITGITLSAPALAEKYDVDVWNSGSTATPVTQAAPAYPSSQVDTGQEGWVRMHFVVTPEGQAADPIIIDSSGGASFEDEARKALADWRFEPPASGNEDAHNLVNIRSEVRGSRDSATKRFRRDHERIVLNLVHEQNEDARENVDELFESGGFNTYEATMLWLMVGRVQGVENNDLGKLESYRRALAVSTRSTLRVENKLGLLEKIFQLEDQFGQYAAALQTFRMLKATSGKREINQDLSARAAEIQALADSDADLTAQAAVYNPCDCEAGTPLWYYKPVRRTFSFANLSGNVTRFEARCESHRVQAAVETGKEWTLAPEWGSCRVFVFGDDGATFEFVEHPTDAGDDAPTAAARDDVLDSRNRGERG
jgi:TonB family protein